MPHGLMFHHFHSHRHPPGQGSIDAREFEALLRHVGPAHILPARQWLEQAQTGQLRPGALCLTFDDNLRCQYDVALPVMRALGLTAFWFVYSSVLQGQIERLEVYRAFRATRFTDVDEFYREFFQAVEASAHAALAAAALRDFDPRHYLAGFDFYSDADRRFRFVRDRALGPQRYFEIMDAMVRTAGLALSDLARDLWMNEECIQTLHAEGHVVGLHSHTHPTALAQLDSAQQRAEYHANQQHLTQLLGTAPVAMSHPCNSYSADTLALLHELGITVGFRANMAPVAGRGPLEWPREDHANVIAEMRRCA